MQSERCPVLTASSWLQVGEKEKRGSGSSQQSPHFEGGLTQCRCSLIWLDAIAVPYTVRSKWQWQWQESNIPRSNYLDLVIAKGENGRSAVRPVGFPTGVHSRVISANGPAEPRGAVKVTGGRWTPEAYRI